MHHPIIEQILEYPDAYLIMQEIQAALAEERKKREAFYNDITDEYKVEFINGEIVMHSPVKKFHNEATGLLFQLVNVFVLRNKLGFVGIEKIMTALTRNDYEPDICFFGNQKAASFTSTQTLFPAPDLVVEVLSDSTAKRDRGIKFDDYQAHGVEEYWIVDPDQQSIEQYHLVNGAYELILKATEGHIRSFVLLGFVIPIQAAFNEDANMQTMTSILQSQSPA
ncbi:Uma2 family endonuclease [Fibrisoma montanum]|uniref:Uma2 family endonuclease n=1 Tax=Fibrisoma montanum TaxID=2305895 RepID=A0A418MEX9_9BACT|nr:Uma2 family endonuclease [Fibrisoma montanum]RIV25283.1 Uma2 family endonuclease [Fibrisoma montanum]